MDGQILFICFQLIKTDQESRLTPVKVQRKEAESLDGDRIKADLSSKKTGGTCFHADINRPHMHKWCSLMGVKVKKTKKKTCSPVFADRHAVLRLDQKVTSVITFLEHRNPCEGVKVKPLGPREEKDDNERAGKCCSVEEKSLLIFINCLLPQLKVK